MADMPDRENDLTTLAGKVVHDSEKLIGEQVALLRAELGQEFQRAGNAAFTIIVGVGLATAGVIFLGLMLAHFVHLVTVLPLWCCYAVVGGAAGVAGFLLARSGRGKLAEVRDILPQTVEAVKENLTWLKKQVTGPGT